MIFGFGGGDDAKTERNTCFVKPTDYTPRTTLPFLASPIPGLGGSHHTLPPPATLPAAHSGTHTHLLLGGPTTAAWHSFCPRAAVHQRFPHAPPSMRLATAPTRPHARHGTPHTFYLARLRRAGRPRAAPRPRATPEDSASTDPPPLSPPAELLAILANGAAWTAGAALSSRGRVVEGAKAAALARLASVADAPTATPADEEALLLALHAAGRHEAVCARVEGRGAASGGGGGGGSSGAAGAVPTSLRPLTDTAATAYLSSAAAAGTLSPGRPPPGGGPLTAWLTGVAARASPGGELPEPGAAAARPLHVLVASPSAFPLPRTPLPGRTSPLAAAVSAFATAIGLVALFMLGASVSRRAAAPSSFGGGSSLPTHSSSAGLPSSSGLNLGGAESRGGAFAPKEYGGEDVPEASRVRFADVKGCDEAKGELEEIVSYLRDPARFTALGGKLPKGVLLTGPPGTGKTLLARAVAGEAGVPFFFRAGSEFEEMFVGVGARRARALFAAAKKAAPCIVFIDEIDAIGGPRKAAWDNGGGRKTLNQLLVEMDGFEQNSGVIVIAATNIGDALDSALTRPGRFDRHVAVPLPDVRGRLDILTHYLGRVPLDPAGPPLSDVAGTLARRTPGFSGAQLAALVNEAALSAARTGATSVDATRLDEARDKLLMGTERRSLVQSAASRRLTAYHEGGHALVAMTTPGARPVHKATIVPRGHALGMVAQLPDGDETSVTRAQLRAQIDVALGGKAAEALVFGEDAVTTGARSDLATATAVARHMVAECGMSDVVGPRYVGGSDTEPSTSRASPDVARAVDAEIGTLLRDAYARVSSLLKEREADLHRLAAALLEHETLTAADVRAVLDGTFARPPPTRPEAVGDEAATLAALGVDVGGGAAPAQMNVGRKR